MAISINWITGVIFVPRADMLEVQTTPVEVRQLDINDFRKTLGDLKDDLLGRPWTKAHDHTPPKTVAGVELARVVEIVPPYTVTFEDGLYNVNIVGGNSNISDRNNKNTVGVNTANSAGLQDSTSLQAASFGGKVAIDTNSGTDGTIFPIGTNRKPSSNTLEGVEIAAREGILELVYAGDTILDNTDNVSGYIVHGRSVLNSNMTILESANVLNTEFESLQITGVLDGGAILRECLVKELNYVTGYMDRCGLSVEVITLGAGSQASIIDCFSNVSGSATPTLDVGGSGQSLVIRGYKGGIRISNRTGSDPISLDLISGHVILDASCTGDPIIIRGSFKLTVEAGATTPDTTGRTAMENTIIDANIVSATTDGAADIVTELLNTSIHSNITDDTIGSAFHRITAIERKVYVDTELLINGDGSQDHPFNNFDDAKNYAEANNLYIINLHGDATIPSNFKNFTLEGVGTPIIDTNGQDLTDSKFYQVRIKGDYTGIIIAQDCIILNNTTIKGFFDNCVIDGLMNCPDKSNVLLSSCIGGILNPPTINMNTGGTSSVRVSNYSGTLNIINMDNANDLVEIGIAQGRITLESSCTLGDANIAGNGLISDSSGASCNVTVDATV